VDKLVGILKDLDTKITANRLANSRIRPTINNPLSSRSIMISTIIVEYGSRKLPLNIVDLPGYELIAADNSEKINDIITKAMEFMSNGGTETPGGTETSVKTENSFLKHLCIPQEFNYRTTAFVIANNMGANPAKLDALHAARVRYVTDFKTIPDYTSDEKPRVTAQRNIAVFKLLTSVNKKNFHVSDDQTEGAMNLISGDSGASYEKFMVDKAAEFAKRIAGELSNGMILFYTWLQRDQRVFMDLFRTQFTEIADKSLSK
jgi:hypothetical protein